MKTECEIEKPKLRKVRRRRCNECCHLESEHIKNAVCWDVKNSHWETVMLPVCIYCGATCEDIEDEMCQKCWHKPEIANVFNGKINRKNLTTMC